MYLCTYLCICLHIHTPVLLINLYLDLHRARCGAYRGCIVDTLGIPLAKSNNGNNKNTVHMQSQAALLVVAMMRVTQGRGVTSSQSLTCCPPLEWSPPARSTTPQLRSTRW
jgi:hypothetical protein